MIDGFDDTFLLDNLPNLERLQEEAYDLESKLGNLQRLIKTLSTIEVYKGVPLECNNRTTCQQGFRRDKRTSWINIEISYRGENGEDMSLKNLADHRLIPEHSRLFWGEYNRKGWKYLTHAEPLHFDILLPMCKEFVAFGVVPSVEAVSLWHRLEKV